MTPHKTSLATWLSLPTFALLLMGILLYGSNSLPTTAVAATTPQTNPTTPTDTAPICRFGVNTPSSILNFNTSATRLGWYIDYRAAANAPTPNDAIYFPMIRLSQVRVAGQRTNDYTYKPSGAALQNAIATNPGASWIIGNEPDRIDVQDDMEPQAYAAAYHELYHLIKTADPTAQIVAGTIVQPTPVRLAYLDLILKSYVEQFDTPMPVDAWNIHNFILNEVSCEYDDSNCWGASIPPGLDVGFGEIIGVDDNDNMTMFAQRIVRFRQWMKNRGYGNRPLYLTEYGILMPASFGFDDARVNAFMNASFDYMLSAKDPNLGYPGDDYRLVQKWSWFSTYDPGFNGNLYAPNPPGSQNYNITAIGQNFANYTAAIAADQDLYPWKMRSTRDTIISNGNPVTLTLQTHIANSGHLARKTAPTLVRFYDGDPQNGGTQIGPDQFVSIAGCGYSATAEVTWPNVPPGAYQIYVWVDPTNTLTERDDTNNLKSFPVLIADPSAYLPLITQAIP